MLNTKTFITFMNCKYILLICVLHFHIIFSVFERPNVLNFIEDQIWFYFMFHVFCVLRNVWIIQVYKDFFLCLLRVLAFILDL